MSVDPVQRVWQSLSPKPTDFNLVEPGRHLLKEGPIRFYNTEEKKMKDRHFFLFNDLLLLCLKEGEKFRLRYLITLNPSVKVEDEESGWSDFRVVSPGSDTKGVEFRISALKKLLVFFARTSAEQKEWVSLIRQAAANQRQ